MYKGKNPGEGATTESVTASQAWREAAWRRAKAFRWRNYTLVLITLALWIAFQLLTSGAFLSQRNIAFLALQSSITGLITVTMVMLILTANFDLSAGSAVALTGVIAAILDSRLGWPVSLNLMFMLGVGALIGAWQGFSVAYLRIPSFLVTLAGLLYLRGISLIMTNAETVFPISTSLGTLGSGWLGPQPSVLLIAAACFLYLLMAFRRSARRRQLDLPSQSALDTFASTIPVLAVAAAGIYVAFRQGIPLLVLLLGAVALAGVFITNNTRFGRHLYAVGSNREAARLAGINVRKTVFTTFVLMGVMYGITGMALVSRLGGSMPGAGTFLELDAIAAAIIGGTSLFGGSGTILGGLLGAVLMESINNGMGLMNVPTFYQYVSKGLLLLAAVYINISVGRRRV